MIRPIRASALVLGLVLLVPVPAARAMDIDFGAAVNLGDDTSIFVNVSSGYFKRDVAVVERYAPRFRDPDDLAVALFLSSRSRRDPQVVLQLRNRGLSWFDVSFELGVPADVWFVPVAHDPGPPYGKAYGHWKKHRGSRHALALSDADARNLVAVRMLHEYYGIPVDRAMAMRASGTRLPRLVGQEYRTRHGKGHPGDRASARVADRDRGTTAGKSGKGGGKGSAKGPGKGKGKKG